MYIKRVEGVLTLNGSNWGKITLSRPSHSNVTKRFSKMQLTPIGSNMTEVETADARILFSYRTPVAAYVFGEGYVKTSTWYSTTTSRHINKWLQGVNADTVDQEMLDSLTT